jgi:hypothetical protein
MKNEASNTTETGNNANLLLANCKKLYSRNYVIEIIYKVLKATGGEIKAEMKNIRSNAFIEYDGSDLEKWIEANL